MTNSTATKIDPPRYRAKADGAILKNGQRFAAGIEFPLIGWPTVAGGAIEPANESARRVVDYYAKHRTNAFLPPSPYDADLGRIFLPPALLDPRAPNWLPGVPTQEVAGMPRYRTCQPVKLGGRTIDAGTEISYCAWPPAGLDPVNDAAHSVVAYFDIHGRHPNRLAAPWCEYAQALVLPELPEARPQQFARNLSDRRDADMDAINARRISSAQAALRQVNAESRSCWADLTGEGR